MGAVHAVSLKYVGLAGMAATAARMITPSDVDRWLSVDDPDWASICNIQLLMGLYLYNVSFINAVIALLFNLRLGMSILGKDPVSGSVPLWSYVLFFGFHGPTFLYTKIQRERDRKSGVAPADEVEPGWWVGGRNSNELGKRWAGNIDLTCEFPETSTQDRYLLIECWDGVPPTPDQLEEAAQFAVAAHERGDVLVHCAHGRGRSTTTLCACLVRAGLYPTWEEAFHAIKQKRRVVKLNRSMRMALTEWQAKYSSKVK
ncbi:Uncharacterized protein YnbD [Symbiodinium microadriaticum]|uniref:Uncharacterized protein YnbD n=1 Tax=Symbiodinium microadriaticum TaxID=2951 RepID=A0A1Q9D1S5_SYMMI|nr:Uncharacterized protein YnbD [Symbiodinium microadriaticum]CAE7354602.1 ynbD [Symbiodinium sp. KB8]